MLLPRALTIITIVAALAATAAAAEKAGVTMPDTMEVDGKRLHLNGMGLREATVLKVDVYVAGLYLEQVSSDPAEIVGSRQTKRLLMRFKREVGRSDILKAWNDGFRNNATVPVSQIQAEIARLNSWMGSFSSGDTLAFTYVPGEGVHVHVNNRYQGTLQGEDFARSLFSIWFGPKPPSGDLKQGMLGSHRGT